MTLKEFLARLEECRDAEDVAALCRQYGVDGARSRCSVCPVARLGQKLTGLNVWVGAKGIWDEDDHSGRVFPQPTAVLHFTRRFDLGEFPELWWGY